ncbi:MAG: Hsp20/alpha crystallin family protein [Thermoguttaceae bacterium]
MYIYSGQTNSSMASEMFHRLHQLINGPFMEEDGPFSSFGSGELLINIWEDATSLCLEMDVPGVTAEEVDLSIAGTELTIKIEPAPKAEDGGQIIRCERFSGTRLRTIDLPIELPPKSMKAELEAGVLCIHFEKGGPVKVQKIAVSSKT